MRKRGPKPKVFCKKCFIIDRHEGRSTVQSMRPVRVKVVRKTYRIECSECGNLITTTNSFDEFSSYYDFELMKEH